MRKFVIFNVLFMAQVALAHLPAEVPADVEALTQLSDEYAATGRGSELQLTLQKLAVMREEWEAIGRPQATPERIAEKVVAWRQIIDSKLQVGGSLEDGMESAIGALPYANELNGSTLNDHEVVVTFDDGPHAKLTPLVHAFIKEEKIPAAFFEVGEMVQKGPKLTLGLASDGYVIGNHSWSHPNFTSLSDQSIEKQINDTQNEIQSVLGGPQGFNQYFQTFFAQFFNMPEIIFAPQFFRSPYGARSARTMNIILNTVVGEAKPLINGKQQTLDDKFFHIMWNVDSLDWKDQNPSSIAKRVANQLATVGHHGVILFHDIHPQTVQAIQLVLPELEKEGYKFLSLYDLVNETLEKQNGFLTKP